MSSRLPGISVNDIHDALHPHLHWGSYSVNNIHSLLHLDSFCNNECAPVQQQMVNDIHSLLHLDSFCNVECAQVQQQRLMIFIVIASCWATHEHGVVMSPWAPSLSDMIGSHLLLLLSPLRSKGHCVLLQSDALMAVRHHDYKAHFVTRSGFKLDPPEVGRAGVRTTICLCAPNSWHTSSHWGGECWFQMSL